MQALRRGREDQVSGREPDATTTPWRISPVREEDRFWIEGPEGSGASDLLPNDRRVICDFELFGDPKLDAEAEANASAIVEAINAALGTP